MFRNKLTLSLLFVFFMAIPTAIAYQQERQIVTLTQPDPINSTLPTNQIIIKFNPTSSFESDIQRADFTPMLNTLSAQAGIDLAYQRPMSGASHVLRLPEKMDETAVAAYATSLATLEGVEYAVPDRIMHIFEQPAVSAQTIPNDDFYPSQWHYGYEPGFSEGINAELAWDITMGHPSIVVSVIDSGILNHADLLGQTVPGYDFIFDPFVANDGNGRDPDPTDPGDWSAANDCFNGSPAQTSSWHGSHVAGTIAAKTNNGIGVAGVAGNSRILPVRALGRCGGYSSDVNDGIRWSAGLPVPGAPINPNPAKVINMSLGGSGACNVAEQSAINAAVTAGATIVVAAGNSSQNAANYSPASCNNVLSVAATNRFGNRAFYSNFGAVVDIAAPGGETSFFADNGVLSTVNASSTTPGADSYAYYQGTSMAAPHVAGVAALVLSRNSALDADSVRSHLLSNTRAFPGGSSCSTAVCGVGIVDAYLAVNCVHTQSEFVNRTPLGGGTFFAYLPFLSNC